MIREIVKYPDPRLREVCPEWTDFVQRDSGGRTVPGTTAILDFLGDLYDTMWAANGVGLVAPQIGVMTRVFVVRWLTGNATYFINPVVVPDLVSGTVSSPEGCLSIPGVVVTVQRYRKVLVESQDIFGHREYRTFEGDMAIRISHEIDHLNGKLITDYETL